MIVASILVLALGQAAPVQAAPQAAAPPFELVMEKGRILRAWATNAPIEAIARRLSEALAVPVRVAPESAKARVSFAAIERASLSELLLRVTPAPLVETQETWGGDSKLVGVLLGGATLTSPDDPPAAAGVLVEGHTDEELIGEDDAVEGRPSKPIPSPSPTPTPAEPEGPFLRISKDETGRVSVRARDQGLGVILFQLSQAYRVRFDMRISEAPTVGELSIVNALPSDLPGILGAGVGVVVRRNIATGEERPLRFFLDAPDPVYFQ